MVSPLKIRNLPLKIRIMPSTIFNSCIIDGSKKVIRDAHSQMGQFWLSAETGEERQIMITFCLI